MDNSETKYVYPWLIALTIASLTEGLVRWIALAAALAYWGVNAWKRYPALRAAIERYKRGEFQ